MSLEPYRVARNSRISLACDVVNAPIQFHWYRADHGTSIAAFFTKVLEESGVTDLHVLALMREELRQRLRSYQGARLAEVTDIKTIGRNPSFELFEIKMNMTGIGQLRLYLVEPSRLGKVGIGLHMHLKDTSGATADDVNRAQDREIDIATRRCAAGSAGNWGYNC